MTTQVRPLFTPIPNTVSPELRRHLGYIQDALRELRVRTGGSYDLGFGSLPEPSQDSVPVWDASAETSMFAPIGTGLQHDGTNLTTKDDEINHDALLNFVANEHVDHSAVLISTSTGLTGGGDITTTRTLSVVPGEVDHDALLNFVSNEHVDHSAVSVIAGNGLTGGGTIVSDRTLQIDTAVVIDKSGIPTYTPTNGTADRAFDANAAAGTISATPTQAEVENIRDAVLELADVVATLVSDLGLS